MNDKKQVTIKLTMEQFDQMLYWKRIGRREPQSLHGPRSVNKIKEILGEGVFNILSDKNIQCELVVSQNINSQNNVDVHSADQKDKKMMSVSIGECYKNLFYQLENRKSNHTITGPKCTSIE